VEWPWLFLFRPWWPGYGPLGRSPRGTFLFGGFFLSPFFLSGVHSSPRLPPHLLSFSVGVFLFFSSFLFYWVHNDSIFKNKPRLASLFFFFPFLWSILGWFSGTTSFPSTVALLLWPARLIPFFTRVPHLFSLPRCRGAFFCSLPLRFSGPVKLWFSCILPRSAAALSPNFRPCPFLQPSLFGPILLLVLRCPFFILLNTSTHLVFFCQVPPLPVILPNGLPSFF